LSLTRRAGLIGAAASLGGCGFRPLYAPMSKGGVVSEELAAVYIAVMNERPGQLLRQALQRRFESSATGIAKRFELWGGLSAVPEAIAIQRDSSSSRMRLTGNAYWGLRKLDAAQTPLTNGNTRVIDGYNINDQEYFAAELEQAAAIRRIAETCADQITLSVASFLKKQAESAA
jgi:LPS-assembly lipoprotein